MIIKSERKRIFLQARGIYPSVSDDYYDRTEQLYAALYDYSIGALFGLSGIQVME